MIDTRELREGNIVSLQGGSIDEVTAIDGFSKKKAVRLAEVESWCYIDEIKPIPLTEAVLMAVGCEKKTCGYGTPYLWNEYLFKNEGHMNFDKQGGGWVFKRSIYGNTIIIAEVEYLHQLQNLIFCLNNEELEINMEELKKAVG